MESKLIKVKTDGDILRDAYVISGLEIDGSEYVVYYIDRDDGENDNIFASKLINNNDGTYNMLNIENANEKINVTNTVKELVMKAVEDSEHDTLDSEVVNLRSKTVKLCPVVINKEQAIDIQKTYITTVKKTVTAVSKKYYDIKTNVVIEQPASVVEPVVAAPVVEQPEAGIVSSVTSVPVEAQTVPTVVEPVLPVIETPQVVVPPVVEPVLQVVEQPTVAAPIVNVQTTTPVLEVPAGIINEPVQQTVVAQPVVQPVQVTPVVTSEVVQQPVVTPTVQVVEPVQPVITPTPTIVQPVPVVQTPVVESLIQPVQQPTTVAETPVIPTPVVQPAVVQPVMEQPEPTKLVLDASKESNLNSALGEISKEAIAVSDINAIKEFGEDDAPVVQATQPVVGTPVAQENGPKVLTKKAGFANSKFFMFIAVGFFIASCIFMGYEAFNYYQIVK